MNARRILDHLERNGLHLCRCLVRPAGNTAYVPLTDEGSLAAVTAALMAEPVTRVAPKNGGPVDAVMAKLSNELTRRARILEKDDELSQTIAQALLEVCESIAVAVTP